MIQENFKVHQNTPTAPKKKKKNSDEAVTVLKFQCRSIPDQEISLKK